MEDFYVFFPLNFFKHLYFTQILNKKGMIEEITHFRSQFPTLMLVANYDAFVPSAEMKPSYDSFGSGVVVMMNIMREFYKIVKQNLKLK